MDVLKSPAATKKGVEKEVEYDTGIVLYSDGGVRPVNPGPGGYGVHGYMYSMAPPKKGTGKPGIVVTANGYAVKDKVAAVRAAAQNSEMDPEQVAAMLEEAAKEQEALNKVQHVAVTPLHYFDGYGSLPGPVSNNYAELMATTRGLIEANCYAVKSVKVFTDSEYVCKGLEKWAMQWKRNNWLKADGTAPANVDTWKELVAARDALKQRGVDVKVSWIKGHIGHLGNECADTLATLGVMHCRKTGPIAAMECSPVDGYWTHEAKRHPFLYHRRMYFNTLAGYNKPGEYYLGDHGKDDEMLGKRISDGCYAVIRLVTPDPIIEIVRDHQIKIAKDSDTLTIIRLDHLFRPDTHKQIGKYGSYALEQVNPRRLDMYCLDREPLTRELNPPRIALRAVESLTELEDRLNLYLEKDPRIVTTDLTDILYERVIKKVKNVDETVFKLKAMYNVGFAALGVDANYPTPDSLGIAVAPVSLSLGIDLLDRNSLKRLEEECPVVTLLSWLEAPTIFRYAVVIESAGNVGIWAGVYGNIRVVDSK